MQKIRYFLSMPISGAPKNSKKLTTWKSWTESYAPSNSNGRQKPIIKSPKLSLWPIQIAKRRLFIRGIMMGFCRGWLGANLKAGLEVWGGCAENRHSLLTALQAQTFYHAVLNVPYE